jgi:ATP-dependent Clp protease ATP-binding subunit ClpA
MQLLLALLDDADASAALRACNTNFAALRPNLVNDLDEGLNRLVIDSGQDSKPTPAFQRVVQRAGLQAKGLNRPVVTGADTFLAIFAETASPAARFLGEQGLSGEDVANWIASK